MTAAELSRIRTFPAGEHYYAAIATCVVDEHGDSTHVIDQDGFAYMHEMDSQVYDCLVDAINSFCLNAVDIQEMVKN